MLKTIKSKKEFGEVFHNGERAGGRLVRITALDNEGDSTRVAFVAAKRLGNAVYRNRCKRILREASRLCDLPQADLLLLMFATNRTAEAKPEAVAHEIERLLKKIEK